MFGENLFEYGYAGRFTNEYTPIYQRGDVGNLNGNTLIGYVEDLANYESTGVNPEKELVNSTAFNLGGDPLFLSGDYAGVSLYSTHNLWYVPGTAWGSFGRDNNDQYRLTFSGSFDLKKPGASDRNKHAIEFGFEYEQRVNRSFFLAPEQLWRLANGELASISNGGLRVQDTVQYANLIIDGQIIPISQYTGVHPDPIFGENDTISFDLIRTGEQSYFDRQFRETFGYGDTELVSVFSQTPDQMSLDMFSPDELYSGGNNSSYTYYGFDYLGNKLETQPDFQDFWTAYDEEKGIYTRPLGAFRPVYMAGFIQDKFAYRDLIFNIGVRVDRFDANQKVPKDPYSPIYAIKTVDEVTEFGAHPANISGDAAVYVDDPNEPTRIVAYRDGDNWYDIAGTLSTNPGQLVGTQASPYLVPGQADIKSEDYNVDLAFEDYTPQITVMPRVAFSFELSDRAIFFAHYDVLGERPQDRLIATPATYYYFEQQASAGALENANLRPERTIDYQIGFKQKLSESSALTISGFYREMRDMVQLYQYNFTYPFTAYTTYRNLDFGTVKGMEVSYDLRRTKNLRLTAAYTLQFAEGTGSGDRSAVELVELWRPNLRTIVPLNYNSRHMINLTVDYSYGEGKDYNGSEIVWQ